MLGINVTGAANPSVTPTPITGIANAGNTIEEARLGLLAGTVSGVVNFDAFEARRQTRPGRLCRGDANGDGAIGAQDRVLITNEILALGEPTSPGQPGANEDSGIGAQDRVLVTNVILNLVTCDDL